MHTDVEALESCCVASEITARWRILPGFTHYRTSRPRLGKRYENWRIRRGAHIPAMYIAAIYAALGDRDRSLEWMRKGYEERSDYMIYLKTEPSVDSLRSDPRFQRLLKLIASGG